MPPVLTDLPSFKGRVVHRGDKVFDPSRYQYCYTSQPEGKLDPAAIIYVEDVEDVKAAVKYAAAKGIAIAVRTGGHQYLGASSTNGDNIQIDLSGKSWKFNSYDKEKNIFKCGPGINVGEMNKIFEEDGLFLPHGECHRVHLGGHIQTGGYSAIVRAFGLTSDYVTEFDIVLADGEVHTARRTATDQEEKDLFFAVLGGSPGNLGVITSITLTPLKDEDYPDSRVMKLMSFYSEEVFQEYCQLICELSDDDDLAADWDILATIVSGNMYANIKSHVDLFHFHESKDAKMRREHANEYTEGEPEFLKEELTFWPNGLMVSVVWANLNKEEKFGPKQQAIFDKFRAVTAKGKWTHPSHWVHVDLDEKTHRPMSKDYRHLEMKIEREFNLPYVKRCWATASTSLSKNGFAKTLADHLDEGMMRADIQIGGQLQLHGGKYSKFKLNAADGRTSFSWRDSTLLFGTMAFYKETPRAKQWAHEYKLRLGEKMIGKGKPMGEQDRRILWASFSNTQNTDGPDTEYDMSNVWQNYYESKELYDRVLSIKNRVDPDGIFTANSFCVGGLGKRAATGAATAVTNGASNKAANEAATTPATTAVTGKRKRKAD